MPRFSIIMPTYNRADTVARAVASVRAQRLDDWELLVVDDGSIDHTSEVLAAIDEPRLRILRQENQGVGAARNAGLRASRGELIAFLDSDDEWPEHHLALMAAFFDAFPDDHVVTSEFWEVFGPEKHLRHFVIEMCDWYPETGRRLGAALFHGTAPHGDPLLRFYDGVEPIGVWANPILAPTGWTDVRHYRGQIFDRWRWGWLAALQPTVLTRRALDDVGLFDTSYRVANDFGFLAELSRRFTMNFLTVPGCYKHEYAPNGKPIAEGHLVTGGTSIRFHQDVLRYHEELFLARAPGDPELVALRGFREHLVARAALLQGQRALAVEYLSRARESCASNDVSALLWLARSSPSDALAAWLYRRLLGLIGMLHRVRGVLGRVVRDRRAA